MQKRVVVVWGIVLAALGLAACVAEYGQGQARGEDCRASVECAAGLICLDQRCVPPETLTSPTPQPPGQADPITTPEERPPFPGIPGAEDTGGPPPADVGPDDDADITADADLPDTGPLCTPGELSCESNTVFRVCRDDGASFERQTCAQGTVCVEGRCIASSGCFDRDGDGFAAGSLCVGTQDCNDSNPEVYPGAPEACDALDNDCDGATDEALTLACSFGCGQGAQTCRDGLFGPCDAPQPQPEICNNGLDDDCDGQIDDGCGMCCTPGSCGVGALCVDCACQEAPRDFCRFQNQPCDPNIAGGDGTFFCLSFSEFGDQGICVGLCDTSAPDPEATCPAPSSTCVFGDDVQGICLDRCDAATQTGCFEGQGCLAVGAGACVPAGPIPEGGLCDTNQGPFNQCTPGAACIDLDGNQSTCERLCNPSAAFNGRPSGCDDDQGCFPFSQDTGICVPRLDLNPGDTCSRFQADSALGLCRGESLCTRLGQGRFGCADLCRLDQGNADCAGGTRCRQSDAFDPASGFGVCRN